MKIFYGFVTLALVILACFGFQTYVIFQLQSQIRTLQSQNDQSRMPKVIVVSYSWKDVPYSGSYYRISANCTLLNISSMNATDITVDVKAQFGTGTEFFQQPVDDLLEPWQTKNYYDLGFIYNFTDSGFAKAVWLEVGWTQKAASLGIK
jgi:hypothetical protein